MSKTSKTLTNVSVDLIGIYNNLQIEQTGEREQEFISAVSKYKYLVPIVYPEISDSILKKDERIRYPRLNSEDDKKYLPVFTNLTELKKWNNAHKEYMTKSFQELKEIVKDGQIVDGITINPMNEDVIINSENMEVISIITGQR